MLIRISSPSPLKSCILDLGSFFYGNQVILLATVDCSIFSLLLLLFVGVYHNKYYLVEGIVKFSFHMKET